MAESRKIELSPHAGRHTKEKVKNADESEKTLRSRMQVVGELEWNQVPFVKVCDDRSSLKVPKTERARDEH